MDTDIFENPVLCKDCGKRMRQLMLIRNGFRMRALQCPVCSQKIYHPADVEEFKRFSELRSRFFKVKLRMVGNSYAISIPREIVDFFKASEDIVTLALEEAGKLALLFDEDEIREKETDETDRAKKFIRKSRRIKIR